jgi:parallel beta-helix repeat protein
VVVRSAPGERATIKGRLWVARGADYVTFENLNLDGAGTSLPSPTIDADHAHFIGNDVTNHNQGTICFLLGNSYWGVASGTIIEYNRIYDCGHLEPRTNHEHGIYVAYARDTKILNNTIYDNADRGIQLRPDAQGTLIRGNVIDGNGEGIMFSGDASVASNDTTVDHNIISNSQVRWNVESYYTAGNPTGSDNVVENNCLYANNQRNNEDMKPYFNRNGGIKKPQVGFTATNNTVANPMFADREAKDFRLRAESPCQAILDPEDIPAASRSPSTRILSEG